LAKEFGFGCWRRSVEDRDAWRPRTEEAKAQAGLKRHIKRRISLTVLAHLNLL
jgi:hypothetical protein